MDIVIYARTSSSGYLENRQNTTPQIEMLKNYAEGFSWNIKRVFEEHISGAKKREERAVLMECIEYAKTNNCLILFNEISRLHRNIWEMNKTISYFVENKINAHFKKENLTLFDENCYTNPMTAVYISCLGMCAEIERENTMYRLHTARKQAIESGKCKLGRPKGAVITKEQKEVKYKEIIRCLKKGQSVADTLVICKSKGVKCSTSTIKRIKVEFFGK